MSFSIMLILVCSSLSWYQVLKLEADLKQGVRTLSGSPPGPQLDAAQERLSSNQLKKEDLLKHILHVEMDIAAKEKEVKKAK